MTHKLDPQETPVDDRWQSASDAELSSALARLESAVETARAAGRPVTTHVILNEARQIKARWRRLGVAINATRNRVASQTADLGGRVAKA